MPAATSRPFRRQWAQPPAPQLGRHPQSPRQSRQLLCAHLRGRGARHLDSGGGSAILHQEVQNGGIPRLLGCLDGGGAGAVGQVRVCAAGQEGLRVGVGRWDRVGGSGCASSEGPGEKHCAYMPLPLPLPLFSCTDPQTLCSLPFRGRRVHAFTIHEL